MAISPRSRLQCCPAIGHHPGRRQWRLALIDPGPTITYTSSKAMARLISPRSNLYVFGRRHRHLPRQWQLSRLSSAAQPPAGTSSSPRATVVAIGPQSPPLCQRFREHLPGLWRGDSATMSGVFVSFGSLTITQGAGNGDTASITAASAGSSASITQGSGPGDSPQ